MTNPAVFTLAALCVMASLPLTGYGQDTQDQDVEMRLEDARQRLEAAAREVAELSGQLAGDDIHVFRHRIHLEDQRRAMIGVNIGDSEGDNGYDGVLVLGVTPGGPAAQAGIKSGDIITAVNGDSLLVDPGERPSRALIEKMQDVEPGEEINLEYRSGNTSRNATVTTEEFSPRAFAFSFNPGWEDMEEFETGKQFGVFPGFQDFTKRRLFARRWGDLELVTLTPKLGEYFGTEEGLLVVRAPDDEELKLEEGDIIVSIDGRRPKSPVHAMRILRSYQSGETLNLEIVRKKRTQNLQILVPDDRLSRLKRTTPVPVTLRLPKSLPPPLGT